MPKFEFGKKFKKIDNNIQINKDIKILIDGKDYMGIEEYREVKNIQFTSKNGIITIEGLFDLSNKQILDLIKLDYLTVSFSKELIKSFKLQFDDPKISLVFYLSKDKLDIIKTNINKLKRKYKNFDTDYKTYIKFTLSDFIDVNILSFLQGIKNDNNENISNLDDIASIDNKDISKGEKKGKKGKRKKYDSSNLINNSIEDEEEKIKIVKEEDEEEEVMNPFLQHFQKKEEEEEIKEKDQKEDNFLKRINYIKINDLDKCSFPPKKNIENNIINNYIKEKDAQLINKLRDKINNNYFMTMNTNNIYPLLKVDENKNQSLAFKRIPFNEELMDLRQNYINDILLNFITILFNNSKFNNKEDPMFVNDYTFVVLSLIKNIENIIIDTKKNGNNNNDNNKKYMYYIQRLEKIVSSLKLFHILFLNCFITNENNLVNHEELYDNFSSPKVQTMRKKLLIEWCMREEKKYITENDLINTNESVNKSIISKQIISFGQIKTAIKVNNNNKKNIFINAKLSNLSKENNNTNGTFSYYVNKQKKINNIYKNFISYEAFKNSDPIKNSWVSFFLQSLLYIENSNEYITKSIKLINEKIKDMNDKSKPIIKIDDKDNNKEILKLNYLLLKIYENLMENNINKEKDKDIIDCISMLSNNNLFKTNNSDHFIQYIILFLLTEVINIYFQNNDLKLNKRLYILLTTIISEILSCNNDKNEGDNEKNKISNIILIIKLLHCIKISNKSKQKIFVDIFTKQNFEKIEKFWEIFENNDENKDISFIDDELKEYINGIYYMNKCDWYQAYKCFLKSKNYDYCMNAYINHFFCLLSEKNIKDIEFEEIINNLDEIKEIDPESFIDFYEDFYQIISFIVNKDKDNWNYEEILKMLNAYIEEHYDESKIVFLNEKNHRMIIKLLYKVLLNKSEQDDTLILSGEESYIKLNNVLFEDKKGLLNDVLKDIIEHKNIQFSGE